VLCCGGWARRVVGRSFWERDKRVGLSDILVVVELARADDVDWSMALWDETMCSTIRSRGANSLNMKRYRSMQKGRS
jgi:hypothetical protein